MTDDEQYCENHFIQNVERQRDGRLIVKLPLKDQKTSLGDSYEIAKRRFLNLERKLCTNPTLHQLYTEFIMEYRTLNHMEPISHNYLQTVPHYYLPHHCVMKPDSTSTKLRVVFDDSCKTSSGKSLNDILHIGPTIQSDLFSILLRFRSWLYVVTADISKI